MDTAVKEQTEEDAGIKQSDKEVDDRTKESEASSSAAGGTTKETSDEDKDRKMPAIGAEEEKPSGGEVETKEGEVSKEEQGLSYALDHLPTEKLPAFVKKNQAVLTFPEKVRV